MKMQKKVLAWFMIGALLVIPVLYFFARVPDTAFRDGAMG